MAATWLTTGGSRLGVVEGGKDHLLTVQQTATRLGMCAASVYRLCENGALPHVKVLNATRIAPADLEAFIASRRAP